MVDEMSSAQSLWLMIAAQSLIFGLMWWVAARVRQELRRSLASLALFNGLHALGIMMVAVRRDGIAYELTHGVADALILWSVVFMWEGARALYKDLETSREAWFVALLLTVPILWMGAYPDRVQERVATLLCGVAYLLLRACHLGMPLVKKRFGHGVARLQWTMAVAMSVFLLVRALGGLGGLWSLDASRDVSMSRISAYITFVALTLINSVLAFSVLRVLMGELEHLTNHDALTSLSNRRGLAEQMDATWAQWVRHRRAFSMLCVDVDHFKSVNDRYGHNAGDEVLCAVAVALSSEVRASDLLSRTGGEEFVVLLHSDSTCELAQVAERLRMAVESIKAPAGAVWSGLMVRVSVGGAPVDEADTGWKDTIHRADTALYEAKRAGRNCVRLAPALVIPASEGDSGRSSHAGANDAAGPRRS
jgi:diguanylate cyclase (GGDEF)-like protein